MLGLIVGIIVIGLIAGALARLVVPGKQNISVLTTIVLGIIGSFVGGFLGICSSTRMPRTAFCSRPDFSGPSSEL